MSTVWFLITGALLIVMALASSVLKRLPLTASMFYLGIGALLGPWGADLLRLDPVTQARALEHLTEVVVIVSLFTAGLKLRLPVSDRRWHAAILLALVAMVLSIGGVAAFGVAAAGLPVAAAVLLGAVLAPTDPVLASDVQVEHEHDAEPLRFTLTGEAGLNDGTAFPFVMLGLGLVGVHELGTFGWRWLVVDVVWAVAAGLAVGTACGAAIGRFVIYLRRVHREALGLDEFLTLGLIALSYGAALLLHAYGFLAVFAAGLSLRRIERQHTEITARADNAPTGDETPANHGGSTEDAGATDVAARTEDARPTGDANPTGDAVPAGIEVPTNLAPTDVAGRTHAGAQTHAAGRSLDAAPTHVAGRTHLGETTDSALPTDVAAPTEGAPAGGSHEEQATHPATAPAYMARALLGFNEQLERLGEVAVVIVVGAMLAHIESPWPGLWLALCLFGLIRPASTLITLARTPLSRPQRAFIAWFGVRGVGSIYYLAYSLSHGVPESAGRALADSTLVVVSASIVLHGVSVTPLMRRYGQSRNDKDSG